MVLCGVEEQDKEARRSGSWGWYVEEWNGREEYKCGGFPMECHAVFSLVANAEASCCYCPTVLAFKANILR